MHGVGKWGIDAGALFCQKGGLKMLVNEWLMNHVQEKNS
jgi:hypothetical protein